MNAGTEAIRLGRQGPESLPAEGVQAERKADRWRPLALLLVGGGLAAMVLVRFFTETVPIAPRILNVVDIPLVFAFGIAALLAPAPKEGHRTVPGWPLWLGAAFLGICAIGVIAHPTRVELGPALVFVYGTLSPLIIYLAVYRLWPPGSAWIASRLIVVLGVAQLISTLFFGLPLFLQTDNPDYVSGTFGTNAYQMVFLLLIFITLLIGTVACERRGLLAKLAPALIALSFLLIVLAQYRALLYTVALSVALIAVILGRRHVRGVLIAVSALLSFAGALVIAAQFIPSLKIEQTFKLNQTEVVSKRAEVFAQLGPLYASEESAMAFGTGPGTYSSRGFVTFNEANSNSRSNSVGAYVLRLTGGRLYSTDVSERFLEPLKDRMGVVSGSYAVESPFSSYISVAAETGIPGLLVVLTIYGIALAGGVQRATRLVRTAVPGDPLPAVALAAVVGMFTIVQMGLLENWLEVTRVTFIAWALLAIAAKETDARTRGWT